MKNTFVLLLLCVASLCCRLLIQVALVQKIGKDSEQYALHFRTRINILDQSDVLQLVTKIHIFHLFYVHIKHG